MIKGVRALLRESLAGQLHRGYEHERHDGSLPLVGVSTFLCGKERHAEGGEQELMRSTTEEKQQQVGNVEAFRSAHGDEAEKQLPILQ